MTPAAPETDSTRPFVRKYYLDNFRAFLTALVIYHHTAIAYGGTGSAHYRSRHHPTTSLALLVFEGVNQSFFMASFFFISAHFTSLALSSRKRSPWQLLRSRFVRLGIPTLLYTIVSDPVQLAIQRLLLHRQPLDWDILAEGWKGIRGIRGPVWYCGLLLIFDTIYICLRSTSGIRYKRRKSITATTQTVGADDFQRAAKHNRTTATRQLTPSVLDFLFIISVMSFSVRLRFPIHRHYLPLNLRLGYLPQYVGYYIFGLVTPSNLEFLNSNEVRTSFTKRVRSFLILTTVATTLAIPLTVLTSASSLDSQKALQAVEGGFNVPAALYAVWNESTGFLLFTTLLSFFRTHLDRPIPIWSNATRYSYPAFLLHRPVSEAVEAALDEWRLGAVMKTCVVGTMNVAASWGIGWALLGSILGG